MRRELAEANNQDLLTEVKAVQKARGWTFERSWNHVMSTQPAFKRSTSVEGKSKVAAQKAREEEREKYRSYAKIEARAKELITESGGRMLMGTALSLARRDPVVNSSSADDQRLKEARDKLEEEKERHRQMEVGTTAEEIEKHTKVLALARKLMSRDTSMGIDEAIRRVYRENPSLVPVMPGKTASARYAAPLESSYLVRAEHAVQFDGLPAVIQYMPPGRSTICPSVDGKPKQITVNVGPGTAAALQADLIRLLSENVRPFIDFNHSEGAAAAIPKRFFWKDGEGVMLELDWTGAGKTAVAGRDFSHFSATFTLSKDGDAINLPPSGPVGSLVNNPAFRSGKRLMAMAR
jgi:hypothetical protein